MDRTKAIFEHIFSIPEHPHTPSLHPISFDIHFEAVGDGLDATALASRNEREKQSLVDFNSKTKPKIGSMLELHHWLFREHEAYSASRHTKAKTKIDETVLKSY